jgi:hypothetical protein
MAMAIAEIMAANGFGIAGEFRRHLTWRDVHDEKSSKENGPPRGQQTGWRARIVMGDCPLFGGDGRDVGHRLILR